MRLVAVIALTASILVGGASPSVGFVINEWETRSFGWKAINRLILDPAARPQRLAIRLANATDTYALYLRAVEDDTDVCPASDPAFNAHQAQVDTYFLALVDAALAKRDGEAKSLLRTARKAYLTANTSRSLIQSRCQ